MVRRVSIAIRFTAIRATTKRLRGAQLRGKLESYTKAWCKELIEETKEYPREYALPTYKRTYKLLRSWKVVDISRGLGIAYGVENKVRDRYGRFYARLVHGGPLGDGQWGIHAEAEWKNLAEVAEDVMGGRGAFRDGVQRIITKYST